MTAYERPTISASRLKTMAGEKGEEGCERKYTGTYCFGMRQSGSPATEFGSALHLAAETLQATGDIPDPESDVGTVLRAGAHLLDTDLLSHLWGYACPKMLVEWEHVGTLPDGTPYVAYIDGHSPDGGATACVVIQDLKTTSNANFALTQQEGPKYLGADLQAMFYAWIMLCDVHWCAPPLESDEHFGPKHWQVWDPAARNAKTARLRWVYFLTRGTPRAWEVTVFVTPERAARFMQDNILPIVAKINAAHQWRAANPDASLDEIDRNMSACSGRGRWCGVYEHYGCDFAALGTPLTDLIQLRKRPQMTPQERLALLRSNQGKAAPAAPPAPAQEAPAAETPKASAPPAPAVSLPSPAPEPSDPSGESVAATEPTTPDAAPTAPENSPSETSAPASVTSTGKGKRGRPGKATPPAPTGGVNPPEVKEAIAKLAAPTSAPATTGALQSFTTDDLLGELYRRAARAAEVSA